MPCTCVRCGNELLSTYKFCNYCGKEIIKIIDIVDLMPAKIKEETYQYRKETKTKYEAFHKVDGVSLVTFHIPDRGKEIVFANYQDKEQILWILVALENTEYYQGDRVQKYGFSSNVMICRYKKYLNLPH